MISIAVVNSSVIQQSRTRSAIEAYSVSRGSDLNVDYYLSGVELLNSIRESGGYEIYIIDIIISEMDGFAIAEKIRASGDKGKIFMINGEASSAWKAYRARANNYLLSPLNREMFFSELDTILEDLQDTGTSPIIEIKLSKGIRRTRLRDFVYAEVDSRVVSYFFTDGNVHKSRYLRTAFRSEIEHLLKYDGLILAGQSLLLNLEHVKTIDATGISLSTGETITPPKYLHKMIDAKWNEYLKSKV